MSNPQPDTLRVRSVSSDCPERVQSLFPLRLTPFEFYYLLDDRADYPAAFSVRLHARGRLDRELFERAFALTLKRHPLLTARVDQSSRGWPAWQAGQPAPIRWSDSSCETGVPHRPSNSQVGVRLYIERRDDNATLSFVFWHVAVDGLGAFQFISDLLVAYEHLCAGRPHTTSWRRLDDQLLRERDGHGLFHHRVKAIDLFRLVQVATSLQCRRAAMVSARAEGSSSTSEQDAAEYLIHTLTTKETSALLRVACQLSVKLNDLLVRDYFLTLSEWNRATPEGRRLIRILVPTNMRRRKDARMPAANVFSYAFLGRTPAQCTDRPGLLNSIAREMATIKRVKRGLYYEACLRIFCLWPALLRWSLNRQWPFATAIFTNLGTGFDRLPLPCRDGRHTVGELAIELGYGAGPIRPDTRVSFAVHTYAGQMTVSIRSDRKYIDAQQRRALLDRFLDRLRHTIASES